jgi:general transcription factor IIIA
MIASANPDQVMKSECPHCFKVVKNLSKHMESHQQQGLRATAARVECPHCSKMVQNLEKHLEVHELGKMTYVCEVCQKVFDRSDHLKIHKLIHTGDKPYACDLCDYRSNQKSNLKTHMKRLHM